MNQQLWDPSTGAAALVGLCGVILTVDLALVAPTAVVAVSGAGAAQSKIESDDRKVLLGGLANMLEAVVALLMWATISGSQLTEGLWVESLLPIALTGLALVHGLQLVTLRLMERCPVRGGKPLPRWPRVLVWTQRGAMMAVATSVALVDLKVRDLVDPGRPLLRAPALIAVTMAPALSGRLAEAWARHRLKAQEHAALPGCGGLLRWAYGRMREWYALPAAYCVVLTVLLGTGFTLLMFGGGFIGVPAKYFGRLPLTTGLLLLGVAFMLLELNLKLAVMSQLTRRRPGLVFTEPPPVTAEVSLDSIKGELSVEDVAPFCVVGDCCSCVGCGSTDGCNNLGEVADGQRLEPVGILTIETTNSRYVFNGTTSVLRMPRVESGRGGLAVSGGILADLEWWPYTAARWRVAGDHVLRLVITYTGTERPAREIGDGLTIVTTEVVSMKPG